MNNINTARKQQKVQDLNLQGISQNVRRGIEVEVQKSYTKLPFLNTVRDLNQTFQQNKSQNHVSIKDNFARLYQNHSTEKIQQNINRIVSKRQSGSVFLNNQSFQDDKNLALNNKLGINLLHVQNSSEAKSKLLSNNDLVQIIDDALFYNDNVTTYRSAFDSSLDQKLRQYRPEVNFTTDKKSPIEEQIMKQKNKIINNNSKQMLEELRDMGSAFYHHHYHNPIVGKNPDWRYNAKWNRKRRDSEDPIANQIGSIKVGEFRRGQGGLCQKCEIPIDLSIAHELYAKNDKSWKNNLQFSLKKQVQNIQL